MLSMVCRVVGVVILGRLAGWLDTLGELCAWVFVTNAVLLMAGVFGFWVPSLVFGLEWLGVFASAWAVVTGVLACASLPGAVVWLYVCGLTEG